MRKPGSFEKRLEGKRKRKFTKILVGDRANTASMGKGLLSQLVGRMGRNEMGVLSSMGMLVAGMGTEEIKNSLVSMGFPLEEADVAIRASGKLLARGYQSYRSGVEEAKNLEKKREKLAKA